MPAITNLAGKSILNTNITETESKAPDTTSFITTPKVFFYWL